MSSVLFPGSFNPFTVGHADLVERALKVFDEVVVAVGVSVNKAPSDIASLTAPIASLYEGEGRVRVVSYSGLTVDAARIHGCGALLRGVRTMADFEYERTMADVNFKLSGLETVILFTRPELASVSSSMVRELMHFGKDVSQFIPQKK